MTCILNFWPGCATSTSATVKIVEFYFSCLGHQRDGDVCDAWHCLQSAPDGAGAGGTRHTIDTECNHVRTRRRDECGVETNVRYFLGMKLNKTNCDY